MITDRLISMLEPLQLSPSSTMLLVAILLATAVFLVATITTVMVRKTLLRLATVWIKNNRYRWDDPLASNRLLTKISWFVPISIFSLAVDSFMEPSTGSYLIAKRLVMSGFVIVGVMTITALLSAINDIHRILRKHKGSTLRGYTDAGKILSHVLAAIFIISIFTGKSPWGILSIMGGLTAVCLLIFKDSLLGFIASIQLTSTDMVRIGDWIEMEQYGADGDVIDMSIHSIRVQNWDKTITTIPTYSLVSSSFKNWRGMTESGGRRIKRAITIDLNSICFCDMKMLDQFKKYSLISSYIAEKQAEIDSHNRIQPGSEEYPLNGRRQTNIGVFRAYIQAYLKNNPEIHQAMTFLVRQLDPTEKGLPLEIYVFSKDLAWANYEAIQADIFDHLLAAAPLFGLKIFQNPSGYDLSNLASAMQTDANV